MIHFIGQGYRMVCLLLHEKVLPIPFTRGSRNFRKEFSSPSAVLTLVLVHCIVQSDFYFSYEATVIHDDLFQIYNVLIWASINLLKMVLSFSQLRFFVIFFKGIIHDYIIWPYILSEYLNWTKYHIFLQQLLSDLLEVVLGNVPCTQVIRAWQNPVQ